MEYLGPRGGGVVAALHAIDLREQLDVSQRHLVAAASPLSHPPLDHRPSKRTERQCECARVATVGHQEPQLITLRVHTACA